MPGLPSAISIKVARMSPLMDTLEEREIFTLTRCRHNSCLPGQPDQSPNIRLNIGSLIHPPFMVPKKTGRLPDMVT